MPSRSFRRARSRMAGSVGVEFGQPEEQSVTRVERTRLLLRGSAPHHQSAEQVATRGHDGVRGWHPPEPLEHPRSTPRTTDGRNFAVRSPVSESIKAGNWLNLDGRTVDGREFRQQRRLAEHFGWNRQSRSMTEPAPQARSTPCGLARTLDVRSSRRWPPRTRHRRAWRRPARAGYALARVGSRWLDP